MTHKSSLDVEGDFVTRCGGDDCGDGCGCGGEGGLTS